MNSSLVHMETIKHTVIEEVLGKFTMETAVLKEPRGWRAGVKEGSQRGVTFQLRHDKCMGINQ